jgi:cystathionine gamma-synthase
MAMNEHLRTTPLWQANSLGSALPDNEYGVSVSLPLWEHVIGYEEGDPKIINTFKSGYPRFFLPPAIAELFQRAEHELASPSQRCIVHPRMEHANHALRLADNGRVESWQGLAAVVVEPSDYKQARMAWRIFGEVVSTRQARDILGRAEQQVTAEEGDAASLAIRQRIADHSGQSADDVFLFPSGMAATFTVWRMLQELRSDSPSLQLGFPYVDVWKVQQQGASHMIPVLDEAAYAEIANRAQHPLLGIFSEALTNPLLQCVDYNRLRGILDAAGNDVPIVIDDTIGTSVQIDASRAADIITTSLTKFFSGAGDVLAGCVILCKQSRHHKVMQRWMAVHSNHALFPADAATLAANSGDYAERVHQAGRTSEALYDFLCQHPKIAKIWHSRNQGGPGYADLQRSDGHSALFSLLLKDESQTPAFYDALRVCKGPSLGTDFTLVCPYTLLAHYDELDWAAACGVPRNLVRVSVGLEPATDLIERFASALG